MLGYSRAMHKHAAPMLAALLAATSMTAGSARAQAVAPATPVPPPRDARPPVPVPMPDSALRQAFDAAARGSLPRARATC